MLAVALDVLPFAISGAILPTWTVFVIALLLTTRPLPNALAFIAGNAAYRLALGLVVLFALRSLPTIPGSAGEPSRAMAVGFLALAVVLTTLGIAAWLRGDRPDAGGSAVLDRFTAFKPAASFALGAISVASPGIQYVYFLGGIGVLLASPLATGPRVAILLALIVAVQVMLLVPVVVYALSRNAADRTLETMRCWIEEHRNRIAGSVLLFAGIWVAIRGITALS
ncbi:MAG: GAP family protein [Actinomycetota bacterium]|nr:GAP family protein [Actinomycetota bacterium]MDZ4178194.1 GAP family protein [Coriobacteriia bacterium]